MKRLSVLLLSAGLFLLAFQAVAQENDDMPIRVKKIGDRILAAHHHIAYPQISEKLTPEAPAPFQRFCRENKR
jgi:hypothetical protein